MKTRWIIATIAICMAVSLYIRIVLPYDNVFTAQWIKFISIDAYWQMANVDKIAPDFPHYVSQIFNVPLFQWLLSELIWCIGFGNPSQSLIDMVAVYFPPILAALTIVPVYIIGKTLFNKLVGLVAAALIAVLPGEWLGRSLLGFTDHHVAEVLFSTTALMFFLLMLKATGRRRVIYIALTALFTAICVYSWTSGILIATIIAIYSATRFALKRSHILILGTVLTTVAVYFLIIRPEFIPAMWGYLTSSNTITTTLEMRPLFFPGGIFTPVVAWGNFTTMFLIAPVAMVILLVHAIRRREPNATFLLIWSATMMAAMLCFRRFSYYFAIDAALLGGFAAWWLWQHINDRILAVATVTVLIVIMLVPNLQVASITARNSTFAPSDAWLKALSWVRNNTAEDSTILAWWDYGYWINRETGRSAYVTPSQEQIPIINASQMFLSPSENYTVEADYIILDYNTIMGKHWAVATWAGENPTKFSDFYYIVKDGKHQPVHLFHPEYYKGLAVRLYNFDGKSVTPTQSTVISFNLEWPFREGGRVLQTVDVYGTYEEAVANNGIGERLVGTNPFISPIPLEKVEGYSLVYQSEQRVEGMPEVKIFRKAIKQ